MILPGSNILPIENLSGCFNDVNTSYKFYWFLSILELIQEKQENIISINDLVCRMVANVWYPVNYFRLSFGKQDKLSSVVLKIKQETKLPVDSGKDEVFKIISEFIQKTLNKEIIKNLNTFGRYVPYRFLSPWFKELKGIPDGEKNSLIIKLADEYFYKTDNLSIYKFTDNQNEAIEIQPDWFNYLQKQNYILDGFCKWHLINFLQKNNPNVPGIPNKLFKPDKRDSLEKARKFWDLVLSSQIDLNCIYSENPFVVRDSCKKEYSIDHFVPWSFVTHNLIWNLVPVLSKSVNSSKSDSLPNIEKYFENFAHLHYLAFRTVYEAKRHKLKGEDKSLEDYTILFNSDLKSIYEKPFAEFKNKFDETFFPLIQIAANMGFPKDWVYSK